MAHEPIQSWEELRDFASGLAMPGVEEAVSWGNPGLKAHGKLWTWWSPYVDAAIFKGAIEERDMLMAADPETFILHKHYAKHNLILVAGGRVDRDWARARLIASWRDMAPKRVLKAWEAEQSGAGG